MANIPGVTGTNITITGTGFGSQVEGFGGTAGNSVAVTFNGVLAPADYGWTPTQIPDLQVPAGVPAGTVNVVVGLPPH